MKSKTSPIRGSNETNVSTEQSTKETHARVPGSYGNASRPQDYQAPPRQGAQASHRFDPGQAAALESARPDERFPKANRIRHRREFLRLQRVGRRRPGQRFVVITAPGRGGQSRLGITASRKVGGAVVRNRIKRLVREFFRRAKREISPAQEILVIALPQAATASYVDVVQELSRALRRAE